MTWEESTTYTLEYMAKLIGQDLGSRIRSWATIKEKIEGGDMYLVTEFDMRQKQITKLTVDYTHDASIKDEVDNFEKKIRTRGYI